MVTGHRVMWICIVLACIGASWFACQCMLVPQQARYAPDWGSAQWIQATDGVSIEASPVAYFRHVVDLGAVPDAAFVTVAASQVFSLYINGTKVGSNTTDFAQGNFTQTYMYDVVSLVKSGANAIALRVANVDGQSPSVRINFGVVMGGAVSYDGSDRRWLATARSSNVYLRYQTSRDVWARGDFAAASWPAAQIVDNFPLTPMLAVNPLLYERPVAVRWLGAGGEHEAYLVRSISLPFASSRTWLRLAAIGIADLFINGHLCFIWNGQAPVREQRVTAYLSDDSTGALYRGGLAVGIYDISPYLHPGINQLAVHVVAPGVSADRVGLANLNAATSLDVLTTDWQGHTTWIDTDPTQAWRASSRPVAGWVDGSDAVMRWSTPVVVARPGASQIYYLPGSTTPRNIQVSPFLQVSEVVLLCTAVITAFWLLLALPLKRRYYHSYRQALAVTSLIYVPGLACEALLITLSREPQIAQPFPYTWFWGMALITLTGFSYLALWLNAHQLRQRYRVPVVQSMVDSASSATTNRGLLKTYLINSPRTQPAREPVHASLWRRTLRVGRAHWAIILLTLVAIPFICYDLAYEPYWQDELSSYYAAQSVLTHGLPLFPSGFLYEKAELYSYFLAGWTLLFGNQAGIARSISALEYIASIPLLYIVGCYFFQRRIALLAAAMLAFSPYAMIWGRQVRMYEQAQLLTILVLYLFYRACSEVASGSAEIERVFLIYVAMLSLVVDYLSHEETFIILPALLLCVLMTSWDRKRHRLPAVLYHKHWWCAALIGGCIIAVQWTLTRVTHPPVLGTDSSQRPFIQLTYDNIPYYFDLLFFPSALAQSKVPWMTINSLLALAGCIRAIRGAHPRAKYCAVFLVVSFCVLVLLFTMRADRYFYLLLPVYYLMGAYALVRSGRALWVFARPRLIAAHPAWEAKLAAQGALSWQVRLLVGGSIVFICTSVLIAPMIPLGDYNLLLNRLVGFSYHRHYPDYDTAGEYLRKHWRRGDIVISVAPDFCTYYYSGHVDYFFSMDRALFLFERNGHIIDTSIGAIALLNQDDLEAVLAMHARVWIVSDNGTYQAEVAKRFTFPPEFRLVFEGYGSAIYFRDD